MKLLWLHGGDFHSVTENITIEVFVEKKENGKNANITPDVKKEEVPGKHEVLKFNY